MIIIILSLNYFDDAIMTVGVVQQKSTDARATDNRGFYCNYTHNELNIISIDCTTFKCIVSEFLEISHDAK